ncbi:CBS domain-containing protein [Flavobacteriaceae bacterium TP-CH-4]|uniref:CBS domain-containing protein n=1 Tax=Pelagihabitans pacificus TaxID=2696054 RepID=A0A967ANU1_9FLAO|nr:CBS domain-containing protein [Pelagihabitans pacificus]NHF57741.1 CBS domain-containing protein [Pelagihabitans pacificus]
MGEHKVKRIGKQEERMAFIQHLLNDVQALEQLVKKGLIEDDVVRIGAEQEFCLVTKDWRPSKKAMEILKDIDEPHFTTELARYNLEINLDPLVLEKDCFRKMMSQLKSLLTLASEIADRHDTRVVLTGILPTISKKELHKDFMTPSPRYDALNEVMRQFRGSDFSLHLKGVDELSVTHDSVLFEACNTSFQMHLQIPSHDFIKSYNWAQAIAGPVMGICCNSPLLMGRELWYETRIALFQQSLDTRSSSYAIKDQQPRVAFGTRWATGSATAVFKEDIALHEVALSKPIQANALDEIKKGKIPKLDALKLHNGTVYRWNRPCYGIGGGKPHLRIENRYIPSGPSVVDEIANFVFWVGLMVGRPSEFDDMPGCMDFRDAKSNFIKAARTGKESVLIWKNKCYSVRKLVIEELLPIAREGLRKKEVEEEDIDFFLKVIEDRANGTTGARWQIDNYRKLTTGMKRDDALVMLTKNINDNQQNGKVVNDWPEVPIIKPDTATLVGHIMSTALFTVHEEDLSDLATSIMNWRNIHHMPVVGRSGELVGLLTWTHMEKYRSKKSDKEVSRVADIMVKKVYYVGTTTPINEAVELMKEHQIGCLPVVSEGILVGIISKNDIVSSSYGQGIQQSTEEIH